MEMSKRAATALEGSIKKWTKIVERLKADEDPDENGAYDCPLCQLYHPIMNDRPMRTGCRLACPIKKDTGQNFCVGSPYEDWAGDGEDPELERTPKAAQAMLDYLIGLRPAK